MAVQTGRTVSKWVDFIVDDSTSTLRSIPVDSINGLGLDYPAEDLTAWQDALMGALPGTPNCVITITGPYDTSVAAAAGTLSGSHTVLSGIVGGNTPLSLDVQVGIRHAWEAGEPQFGITATATSGFLCRTYDVDLDNGSYSAEFYMFPGSAAPAWGIAAET
jgi:hypothetical protein